MKNLWTKKEIKLLYRYEKLSNGICSYPDEFYLEEMEEDILFMEAQLRVIKKYVIGNAREKVVGIFTFSEALKAQKNYNGQGELFTYRPINFKSEKQFIGILNEI